MPAVILASLYSPAIPIKIIFDFSKLDLCRDAMKSARRATKHVPTSDLHVMVFIADCPSELIPLR